MDPAAERRCGETLNEYLERYTRYAPPAQLIH